MTCLNHRQSPTKCIVHKIYSFILCSNTFGHHHLSGWVGRVVWVIKVVWVVRHRRWISNTRLSQLSKRIICSTVSHVGVRCYLSLRSTSTSNGNDRDLNILFVLRVIILEESKNDVEQMGRECVPHPIGTTSDIAWTWICLKITQFCGLRSTPWWIVRFPPFSLITAPSNEGCNKSHTYSR